MKYFAARLTALLVILASIGIYQYVTVTRADAEEIAWLEVELEDSKMETSNALKQLSAEQADAEAAEAEAARGPYAADGTFEGTADGYGGAINVSVTVEEGYITVIDVTSHDGEDPVYYMMAESVIDEIVDSQDPNVDAVTGATMTSTGLKNAVKNALSSAG